MSAFVLDAGALVAVDRDDRDMIARLRVAEERGIPLVTHALIVAQVWRDARGRQARLGRLLDAVDVRPLDEAIGRDAGILLGKSGLEDPIDAAVVLIARHGDRVLTSDVDDISRLAGAARRKVVVVGC